MRFIAVIACLLLAGTVGALSQERDTQMERREVIRLLGQLPDIAPVREDLQRLGFRGENLALAVRQAELLYRDPVIAGYVADRVIAAFEDPTSVQVADGLMWPLIERGLGHLTTGELKFYYTVERTIMEAMTVRQCGLAVSHRMRPQHFAEVTSRVAARMNTEALKEYYRIQAKAARIGARRAPVRLSAAEIRRVEERVQAVMTRSIEATDRAGRLMAAMVNLDRASTTDACAIGRLFLNTVLQFEGRALRESLVYMSQS
ncbi:MAG: hypothetical protein ACE369_02155 [Roseovarius sp.]